MHYVCNSKDSRKFRFMQTFNTIMKIEKCLNAEICNLRGLCNV